MKKLKVGVAGAGGRMGQEILTVLKEQKDLEAYLGLEHQGEAGDFKIKTKNFSTKETSAVDVWIDFSSPEGLDKLLPVCIKEKKPIVSGTTGLSVAQKKALEKAAEKIPVLWASNMSLGVAVLNEALELFGKLKGFDFQIEEIHHNRKKDKPSGTAITLQETLKKATGEKIPEPLSIRGGGVFGVHKVWALSDEEVLSFEHQALNRAVFAKGAVKAARWLAGKKPGLYTLKDLLRSAQ